MLRHLLESQPRRARTRSAAFVSLLIHASIVGTAVAATRTVVAPDVPIETLPVITYVTPVNAPETPAPRRARPEPTPVEPTPAPPSPMPPIIAPTEIPTGVSEPDPSATATTEVTFLPTSPGGNSGGEPGAGESTSSGTGEAMWADEVEKAARPLGRQREPRYPDMLRTQRVEGQVVVAYVVDSLGRVEPNSIRMVESAHPLFEPAVRQAVLASRFRPAEWRGRAVRQLVQQAFVFTLAR
jgi:protein TonB